MSVDILDYIPCNLTFYSQQLLPAWLLARKGQFEPLREIIASAQHFSIWPYFTIPNPFPRAPTTASGEKLFYRCDPFWPGFLNSRYVPNAVLETLPPAFITESEFDFWQTCLQYLPLLFSDPTRTEPQTLVLSSLFYTLCCQLPAKTPADSQIIGNDDVGLWEAYTARDEQAKTLWDTFKQPPPQPLADQLLAPMTYQEFRLPWQDHPRYALRDLFDRISEHACYSITGFLDPAETIALLAQTSAKQSFAPEDLAGFCVNDAESKQHTDFLIGASKEKRWTLPPELDYQLSRVSYRWPGNTYDKTLHESEEGRREIGEIYLNVYAYWYEQHPQEMQQFAESHYQTLEKLQTEILGRFRYAAERGWGMIRLFTC